MLARTKSCLSSIVTGALDGLLEALGDVGGVLGALDVLEQHGELVAAEPGGGVGRAERREQPLADLAEHLVSDGVAEAVVDRLEVVEVDEHDAHRRALLRAPRQRVRDAIGEECAVREPGDRVVERLVGELPLERLALADVA